MVDSPYYRPPEEDEGSTDEPARTVRKTRRAAGGAAPADTDDWVLAFSTEDPWRAGVIGEGLDARGIANRARTDRDSRVGMWRDPRFPPPLESFEIWVPATEGDLAVALIEGPLGQEVEARANQVPLHGGADDAYFEIRNRMDIEMPRSGLRAKDRAARRELARLDGAPVTDRPVQAPANGCRTFVFVGGLVVIVLIAVLLVATSR